MDSVIDSDRISDFPSLSGYVQVGLWETSKSLSPARPTAVLSSPRMPYRSILVPSRRTRQSLKLEW
jgi:hypothetical protein